MEETVQVFDFQLEICSLLESQVIFYSKADDDVPEKRYVAALAKNDQLLNSISDQEKDFKYMNPTEDSASYRNEEIMKEYPNFVLSDYKKNKRGFLESKGRSNFADISQNYPSKLNSSKEAKRNVATLARLGRLNGIRYGRLQSRLVGAKRISNDQNMSIKESNEVKNDLDVLGEIDCNDDQNVDLSRNWQTKRYVAALARSGRLPIWHSQRMWGAGKRDDSSPYRDDSRSNGDKDDIDNAIDETARVTTKYKKCNKIYGFEFQKRNIAALAKNGRLPFNTYQGDKRNIQSMARNGNLPFNKFEDAMAMNGNLQLSNNQEGKRNIQAMARKGQLPSFRLISDKRNIQSMARNGNLPFSKYEDDKRIAHAMTRNVNRPYSKHQDEKRNIQAIARKGLLPSLNLRDGKRSVQDMARNKNLLRTKFEDDKRNIQSMARNGILLYNKYGNEKRNIQAMARNGKLLFNSYPNGKRSEEENGIEEDDFQEDKRNLPALSLKWPFSNLKRNFAAISRNRKFPYKTTMKRKEDESKWERNRFSNELQEDAAIFALNGQMFQENKRNIAALARNGKLPVFIDDGKRNTGSLARKGILPLSTRISSFN